MTAHPLLDLSEQDILRLRVAQQVVQLDRGFSTLDHIIKLLVGFLNAVKSCCIRDVLHLLLVKLVMEALKLVTEYGLRPFLLPIGVKGELRS